MPQIESKLNPRSEDFKANAAAMQAVVDDLHGGGVGLEVLAAGIELAFDLRHCFSFVRVVSCRLLRRMSVNVKPAQGAIGRIGLAHEIADLVQPLGPAANLEPCHEFHRVALLVGVFCFTLT